MAEYSDFSAKGDYSKFKLIVKDKIFYVNAHYLAQISPEYFGKLCFSNFKEKTEGKAVIPDEKSADILELLRCLVPCSKILKTKSVTVENFSTIVRLADKYQIIQLLANCENFIETEFSYQKVDEVKGIEMLISAVKFNLSKNSLAILMGRVATFKKEHLENITYSELSKNIIAGLLIAMHEYNENVQEHVFFKHGYGLQGCPVQGCARLSWLSRLSCVLCVKCYSLFCQKHKNNSKCTGKVVPGGIGLLPYPSAPINRKFLD